eukprot:10447075-Alexandrium_andersonii.AAC.1
MAAPGALRPIKVATDISGMDNALTAAWMLGLATASAAYCDSWQAARGWAATNHGLAAAVMHSDALTRPPLPPDLDLYVAGPPCQA